jgi:hypothetical protein
MLRNDPFQLDPQPMDPYSGGGGAISADPYNGGGIIAADPSGSGGTTPVYPSGGGTVLPNLYGGSFTVDGSGNVVPTPTPPFSSPVSPDPTGTPSAPFPPYVAPAPVSGSNPAPYDPAASGFFGGFTPKQGGTTPPPVYGGAFPSFPSVPLPVYGGGSTVNSTNSGMIGYNTPPQNNGYNPAGSANVPQAPTMYTGGNLVNSVNARYQADFTQKQGAVQAASDALQTMEAQITRRQGDISDQQRQKDAATTESQLWFSRHSGCGPFSRYGCGECEDKSAAADKQAAGNQQNIDAINSDVQTMQAQIANYLQPQLTVALGQLNASYSSYNRDVAAAAKQESDAAQKDADVKAQNQNTALQSSPSYVAAQNAAKDAAAAAALKVSDAANKTKLETYGIIAAVVVLVLALGVVALKITRR